MLQIIKRKTQTSGLVGISLSDDRIAVAQITRQRGDLYLEQCAELATQGRQPRELLPGFIAGMNLARSQCNFVLSPRDYNVYLVEAPAVEADELKAAVRWKIKDLIDIPAEDAVIEVFPVPDDAFKGRSRMLYAVVAVKSRVEQIIELARRAELELVSIDIPEMAMRNLVQQFANDDNGLAFLSLRESGSCMNLSRLGSLYLTRRINTQSGDDMMTLPDWESTRDRLVLEIQRSLDYYESQMGQNPVSRLLIAPRARDTAELIESLNSAMAVEVSALEFAGSLEGAESISAQTRNACMMAIGAALRSDEGAGAE